jgi:hypothetical protein
VAHTKKMEPVETAEASPPEPEPASLAEPSPESKSTSAAGGEVAPTSAPVVASADGRGPSVSVATPPATPVAVESMTVSRTVLLAESGGTSHEEKTAEAPVQPKQRNRRKRALAERAANKIWDGPPPEHLTDVQVI